MRVLARLIPRSAWIPRPGAGTRRAGKSAARAFPLVLLLGGANARAGESAADPTAPPIRSRGSAALPAVDVEGLRARAPSPQWDVGVQAGICGLGKESPFERALFCGQLTADVSFLRERDADGALGLYLGVGTAGFEDLRVPLGVFGMLPVSTLFQVQASAAPLLHTDARGASLGFEGTLSFGLRMLNQSGHYGHQHALVLGVQHTPGDSTRSGTLVSAQLRFDAFWFALPVGLLF